MAGAATGAAGRGVGDRVVRSLSHPIRIEILRLLDNRTASPKELAAEAGEKVSMVAYHFKYLRDEGCIEIASTKRRRGAIEHYYRLKRPKTRKSARPSPATRAELSGEAVRSLAAEAVRALNAGTFDTREDRQLSWLPMQLDEQGWRELIACQEECLARLERVKAEAKRRLEAAKVPGTRVVAGLTAFETPAGPGFAKP
jgi:DNA-binding transcriptional ArsR family regulator